MPNMTVFSLYTVQKVRRLGGEYLLVIQKYLSNIYPACFTEIEKKLYPYTEIGTRYQGILSQIVKMSTASNSDAGLQ